MILDNISQKYMQFSVRNREAGYIAPILRPLFALRYVADCLEAGHNLLGMSGFHYFADGKIQPDLAFEVDAEKFKSQNEFLNRVGGVILSQLDTNVVFEVAFEEGNANRLSKLHERSP